jgi:hypothetical protein
MRDVAVGAAAFWAVSSLLKKGEKKKVLSGPLYSFESEWASVTDSLSPKVADEFRDSVLELQNVVMNCKDVDITGRIIKSMEIAMRVRNRYYGIGGERIGAEAATNALAASVDEACAGRVDYSAEVDKFMAVLDMHLKHEGLREVNDQ